MQHLPLLLRRFLTFFLSTPLFWLHSTISLSLCCWWCFFYSWGGSVSRGRSPTQGGVTHAVPLVQCSHLRIVVREDMAATAPLPPLVPSPVDLVPPPPRQRPRVWSVSRPSSSVFLMSKRNMGILLDQSFGCDFSFGGKYGFYIFSKEREVRKSKCLWCLHGLRCAPSFRLYIYTCSQHQRIFCLSRDATIFDIFLNLDVFRIQCRSTQRGQRCRRFSSTRNPYR